ncbi:unnamed protein product [Choristocarpus tenellus]
MVWASCACRVARLGCRAALRGARLQAGRAGETRRRELLRPLQAVEASLHCQSKAIPTLGNLPLLQLTRPTDDCLEKDGDEDGDGR